MEEKAPNKIQAWVQAFRLRTLPLAFASILLAGFLAKENQSFNGLVLLLSLLTTLFLQVLSNLANDYGDAQNGADNAERVGPKRMVQSGLISPKEMLVGMVICTCLSLLTGIALIWEGTKGLSLGGGLFFLVLGIVAIAAAIKYTAGKNPYGYMGLGDISVSVFFGLTGVLGSYFLHTHALNATTILPAVGIGLLATAVLNINNMRDIQSDERAGKITLPVRMGMKGAKTYHTILILGAWCAFLVFALLSFSKLQQAVFLLVLPISMRTLKRVLDENTPSQLDPFLKKTALQALLIAILLGVGSLM